jgi:hypothetical protein
MIKSGLSRSMPIASLSLAVVGLAGFLGCNPPEVHLSSMPLAAPTSAETEIQSRVLPLALEKAFPKAVDVLLDMGFQIRCASQEVGQINIYKVWYDTTQIGKPQITLEATLLLRAEAPTSTRIRMSAIGKWKLVSTGGKNSASADISGAVPTQDASDYQSFLDRLEEGIRQAK